MAVCSLALLPAPCSPRAGPPGGATLGGRVLISRYVKGRPPLVVELLIPLYQDTSTAGGVTEVMLAMIVTR